jgi:hypothetical protein
MGEVETVDSARVARETLQSLGITASTLDIASPTALCASIRRAASFLCPTTPAALVRTVVGCVSTLAEFPEETDVVGLVDALVAYGDLIELPVDDGTRLRRQLFLGPPAYVPRHSGIALLIGIRPDGVPLLSDDLAGDIENLGHRRVIRPRGDQTVEELLADEGLIELHHDQWLRAPRQAPARDVVAFYSDRLDAAGPSGDIEGIQILDPASRVTYYRGRWRVLRPLDRGRFVARRPQAFGADLWCFAEVDGGVVVRLIDLPIENLLAPGADEAWRLQAALDAVDHRPQELRIREDDGASLFDFFAPVPSWIRRRLDVIGEPADRGVGALFSYALPLEEVVHEIEYFTEAIWLSVRRDPGGAHDG